MWDVLVTFMLMAFGAFVVIVFGVILIWTLYLLQNEVLLSVTISEEDEAFNDIERQAKQRKESVRAALEPYLEVYKNPPRNQVIEEVAQRFEKARDGCSPDDIMGRRWMNSAAELVRSMKK